MSLIRAAVFVLTLVSGVAAADVAMPAGSHATTVSVLREARGERQEPQEDRIEKLLSLLAQGGREAKLKRENAVDRLLELKDRRAHEELSKHLGKGDDADRVNRYVLGATARRLQQQDGTVLARESELRADLLALYVPAWVGLWIEGGDGAPTGVSAALLQRAGDCLQQLTPDERRDRILALLPADAQQRNPAANALAAAALRAGGYSRDLTFAPSIAAWLADDTLGAAARDGLRTLTFEEFATREAFEAWNDANADRDYADLAVGAARRAELEIDRVRREGHARLRDRTLELIEAVARAAQVDWVRLQRHVLSDDPPGSSSAYLQRLREVIATRTELGGVPQDRIAFAKALRARLSMLREGTRGAAAVQEADVLETLAYLVVDGDEALRSAVEAELLAAIDAADLAVRRAGFAGLQRFPSVANRARVVAHADAALRSGRYDELALGLDCLYARAWRAPATNDGDREAWILLLRSVLADSNVPVESREIAARIAGRPDTAGGLVGEMFDHLLDVVKDAEQPVVLRVGALIRLRAFAIVDGSRASVWVRRVGALLEDGEAAVRAEAATQLQSLPPGDRAQQAEWAKEIVVVADQALASEAEAKVVVALTTCMQRMAAEPGDPAMVIGRLSSTARRIAADAGTVADDPRRAAVVDALRQLGSAPGRELVQWVVAGEGLAALGARDALRQVLGRHEVLSLVGTDLDGVDRAMTLVVAAARLRSFDRPWSESLDEARAVVAAMDELDRLGVAPDDAATRAVRVSALHATGAHDIAVARGRSALDATEPRLVGRPRFEVTLAVADALMRTDQLQDAGRMLETLDLRNGAAVVAPRVLGQWEALAIAHRTAGAKPAALSIVERVREQTSDADPAFPARLVLLTELRLDVDADQWRTAAKKDLVDHADRFAEGAVPADLRTRYLALQMRVEG